MADNKIFIFFLIVIVLQINSTVSAQRQEGRIINSTEATIEKYPFTASIQWCKYHICGGVIISTEYILTSARCLKTFEKEELKIVVGSTSRSNYGPLFQELAIADIIIHNKYESATWKYDIAILKLSEALVESTTVKPIGFYEGYDPVEHWTELTVLGWGVLIEGASFYPLNLHAKDMRSEGLDYCIARMEEREGYIVHPESMFCASGFEPSTGEWSSGGICDGDYGGPLVTTPTNEDPEMRLVGLASRGFGCNRNYPYLFTNLQRVRNFITANTGLWGKGFNLQSQ